jgi:hypothetical protein
MIKPRKPPNPELIDVPEGSPGPRQNEAKKTRHTKAPAIAEARIVIMVDQLRALGLACFLVSAPSPVGDS